MKRTTNKNQSEKTIAKNLLICSSTETRDVVKSITETVNNSDFLPTEMFKIFLSIMMDIAEHTPQILDNFSKENRINLLSELIKEKFIEQRTKITKTKFNTWLDDAVDKIPSSDGVFFFSDEGLFQQREVLYYYYWECMKDSFDSIDENQQLSYESKFGEFKLPDIRDVYLEKDIYKLGDVKEGLSQSSIYTTGVEELDNYIFFQPTNLAYVGARPSVGKSLCVVNMCLRNALRGIPCLYVSFEMTPKQTRNRVNSWIEAEQKLRPVDVNKINENIFLLDAQDIDGDYVFRKVDKFASSHPGCIVVLDHIGLIRYNGKDEWGSLRQASLQAKTTALKTKCVMIGVAQASRESEMTGFSMSSLFGSSTLEQDSDIIIGMEPQTETKVNFVIAKNRDGIRDVSMVTHIDKATMHFE